MVVSVGVCDFGRTGVLVDVNVSVDVDVGINVKALLSVLVIVGDNDRVHEGGNVAVDVGEIVGVATKVTSTLSIERLHGLFTTKEILQRLGASE